MQYILRDKKSTMDVYLIDEKKRPFIIIAPGGGYDHTSLREGGPVAKHLNSLGYHCAVINYRNELYPYPEVTLDIAASVKIIIENYLVEEIITMGFSAGAHAIALYNTQYTNKELLKEYYSDIKIKRTILCYPVITTNPLYKHVSSFEYLKAYEEVSIEKLVDENFPKTFIWHTITDESVPVYNTILMMKALSDHKINYEAHLYPMGGHGLSLATKETAANEKQIIPYVARWSVELENWLKNCR